MRFGIWFPRLRLTIVGVVLLAQVYLFVRIRRAILSSHRSDRFKVGAVRLVGLVMALVFATNVYLLFRQIPWVDPPLAAQVGLLYPVAIWNIGSAFSALLLLLARLAGGLTRLVVPRPRVRAARNGSVPVDPGRRRFLRAGVGAVAATPVLFSGYGAAYAGRAYDVERFSLPFGRSLRVVQLTDIHAGIYMTRDDMRRYAAQVIALQPDLFVLTGDFISNSMVCLPGCVEEMARVRARYGTFATLGNHEHVWGNAGEVEAEFRRGGIPLLTNAHTVIRTTEGPFAVAGIDDLQWGRPDLNAALRGLDPAMPTLLLSHRPEIFPAAAARGIPLTLSGHYHGGQIKLSLPGGDLSLAHLRSPYPEGLYRIDDSHLYVSRGIGTTFTPVRLNARPEVTVFELT
ncbi:MAG: metallophosphoesterase [Zetaproteobacteria bacterium]|nr:MAG: metallophosphoesterase [Zetaproteobacteria bacterium]